MYYFSIVRAASDRDAWLGRRSGKIDMERPRLPMSKELVTLNYMITARQQFTFVSISGCILGLECFADMRGR
jgi:hypothetical protein